MMPPGYKRKPERASQYKPTCLVSGLPCSGNKLFSQFVKRLEPAGRTMVVHGHAYPKGPERYLRWASSHRVLIPIRNPRIQAKATRERYGALLSQHAIETWAEYRRVSYERLAEYKRAHPEVQFAAVAYEDLVADPLETLRLLACWLDVDSPDETILPTGGVRTATHEGRVFDANAKYLEVPEGPGFEAPETFKGLLLLDADGVAEIGSWASERAVEADPLLVHVAKGVGA